ncbi:MAG: 2-amino-4-hydroxy-6-hydroxymethyldihydropteridine diphosphokinase [Piscirickettsiaceae bacterium]|nr:2-amino-4-hydroxy-6-hydroxymethyldihydropteridine diphosphokinase [Piscirickettsiaceae bacterium]
MKVYIGLGSNLADPQAQVNLAIDALRLLPTTSVVQQSSLYMSPPMGPPDQPDYINAVVEIETKLTAHTLLDQLQSIEQQQGRVRKRHWGERTIDLDLLLYGDQIVDDERLQIPHPGIPVRAFVLYPLVEIAPELTIPDMGQIDQLTKQCPLDGLQRVENS